MTKPKCLSFIILVLAVVGIIFISGCVVTDKCSGIEEEVKRTLCYQNAVKTTKDPSICEEKMPGVPERNVCYDNLAIYHNDHNYCEKITGTVTRANCYYEIALDTEDLSLCEKIDEESIKELCIKHFST